MVGNQMVLIAHSLILFLCFHNISAILRSYSDNATDDCASGKVITKVFIEIYCGQNEKIKDNVELRMKAADPGVCYLSSESGNRAGEDDGRLQVELSANCR